MPRQGEPTDERFSALAPALLAWLGAPCAALDGRLRYVFASPAWAALAGATSDELVGQSAVDRAPLTRALGLAMARTQDEGVAHREALASGELVWSRVRLPTGATAFMLRVEPARGSTGRSAAAPVAEPAHGSEDPLRKVGQVAAAAAHHFNNVLSVVVSNVDVALAAVPDGSALRRLLDEVRAAAMRGEALTQQLLAAGQRQPFRPREAEFDQVIEAGVERLRAVLGDAVALRFDPGAPGCRVSADMDQLAQALVSLGMNARDALPRGGKVAVTTRVVALDEPRARALGLHAGNHAELCVEDRGVGMSDEVRERAFEPFFTTRGEHASAGLGLAAVREVVALHGGAVVLESAPAQGTTARVLLPCVAADDIRGSGVRATHGGLARRAGRVVLLAEDEDLVRSATRRVLEVAGFTVLTACDGVEALAICEQSGQSIDVLLSDIVMPRMDGRELARRAQTVRPGLPVVLITGFDATGSAREGGGGHELVVLRKPVEAAALVAALRAAMAA